MPQLDIQIFFIDTFFGFFGFWALYIYNNKVVFPEIKRSILLREVKILTWKLFFIEFKFYFSFWEKKLQEVQNLIQVNLLNSIDFILIKSFKRIKGLGLEIYLNSHKIFYDYKKAIMNLNFCKNFL